MSAYVYIQSGHGRYPVFTVGFYTPAGNWIPEKDFANEDAASKRVAFLNSGVNIEHLADIERRLRELETAAAVCANNRAAANPDHPLTPLDNAHNQLRGATSGFVHFPGCPALDGKPVCTCGRQR